MLFIQNQLFKLKQHFYSEDGVGVVEMILILVVLVALVIVFKTQLNTLVTNIFKSISSKSSSIYS